MAFSYYRSVTLLEAQAGTADSTNFPVTFTGTYAYLATVANGGKVQNSSGYDIGFYPDSALTTKLDWEMVTYTPTTGFLEAHVRVPTLSASTDTVIYLAYGDSGISTFQGNVDGTWNSGYKQVYHLKDGTTLAVTDSSGNASNGTNSGATANTGKIDGGAGFNGSGQYVGIPSVITTSTFTLSAWIKTTDTSNQCVLYIGNENTGGGVYPRVDSSGVFQCPSSTGGSSSGVTVNDGSWHLVVARVTAGTSQCFVDGASAGSSAAVATPRTGGLPSIGNLTDLGTFWPFNGSIDEVRVSDVALSADWITAEYNNQSNPSTFYTMGSEVPVGGGGGGASPYYLSYYSRLVLGVAH